MSCGTTAYTDVTVLVNRSDEKPAARGRPSRAFVNVETGEEVNGALVQMRPGVSRFYDPPKRPTGVP